MLNWLFSMSGPGYGGYGGYANGGSWNNYWSNPQPINTPRKDYSEERLHSLELACAALWELLKQKNGYTDDELKAIIHTVSQQGVATPVASSPGLGDPNLSECPKCHHKLLTQNHTKCLWCGADIPQQPFVN